MNKITKISFIKGYGLKFLLLGLTNLDLRFTVKWWGYGDMVSNF